MPSNTRKPNLVLIFSDQQHWRAMGHVDPFFETPALDHIAQQSVCFDHAFCTTPQCSPSRSSMFTGLYPHRTGVLNNVGMTGGDELRLPTLGRMLQEAGYHTGYFGKWHLGDDPAANDGWDIKLADRMKDPDTVQASIDFLRQGHADKPLALVVSINDPHDIYHFHKLEFDPAAKDIPLPASWENETFVNKPKVQQLFMQEDQGKIMAPITRQVWEHYHDSYRKAVLAYDRCVGRLTQAMKDHGLWDDSVLVVTSDHGDMDTHHRLIYKGPFMYDQLMRVPLMVRVPAAMGGKPAGTCGEQVVLTDLVPTFRELAGLEKINTDGQSLLPLVSTAAWDKWQSRSFVIGQYFGKQKWVNPMRMIRTSSHKYILASQGLCELYDLAIDPDELVNRIDDPAYVSVKQALHEQLLGWMREQNDPFFEQQATDRKGQPLLAV